jgi:TPR repeat protein
MTPSPRLALAAFSFLVVASCGGAAGRAVRPGDPTATDALGDAECHDVSGSSEPLVVDWKPEQRGHLELAMRDSVAIVSYSCKGIKLLNDCKLDGTYGYMGVTRKEQVISLSDSDEVKANLPLSGVALGAELKSGSSLDVAMVMVGQQKTTWDTPTTSDLKGKCDGATHYVRGATVGAFALATSTSGEAKAVASFFGAGAEGASASKRQTKNKEGDLTSCQSATPKSAAPPDQCGSPIRLLIAPIAKPVKDAPPAKKTELAQTEEQCPKGLVFAEGKCTKAESAKAYQCKPDNESECSAQCEKGHAGSCGTLGVLLAQGGGGNDTKAAQMFQKGCTGGDNPSCTNLGRFMMSGRGVSKNEDEAGKLFDKACLAGDAQACGLLADTTKDAALAANLHKQACSGGYQRSCTKAARAFAKGDGVSADKPAAIDLYKKGCYGGDVDGCLELGKLLDASNSSGEQLQARTFYERGCMFGSGEACVERGRAEFNLPGGSKDSAKQYFERGCLRQNALGCAAMKVMYGSSQVVHVKPDVQQEWRRACDKSDADACAKMGLSQAAQGMTVPAKLDLQRACTGGSKFACAVKQAANL